MELRVLNNCRIGGCPAQNLQSTCPECPHWTPSRSSKYYACRRWHDHHLCCDLPRAACQGCEHHIENGTLPKGRPNESGIDWTDPDQKNEYLRQKKRESRRRRAMGHAADQSR